MILRRLVEEIRGLVEGDPAPDDDYITVSGPGGKPMRVPKSKVKKVAAGPSIPHQYLRHGGKSSDQQAVSAGGRRRLRAKMAEWSWAELGEGRKKTLRSLERTPRWAKNVKKRRKRYFGQAKMTGMSDADARRFSSRKTWGEIGDNPQVGADVRAMRSKLRSESSIFEGGGSRSDKAARQDAFLRKATGSVLQRDKKRLRRSSWDKYGHADDPGSVFVTKDGREPSHPRTMQRFLKSFGAKIDAKTNKRKVVGPSGRLPG